MPSKAIGRLCLNVLNKSSRVQEPYVAALLRLLSSQVFPVHLDGSLQREQTFSQFYDVNKIIGNRGN